MTTGQKIIKATRITIRDISQIMLIVFVSDKLIGVINWSWWWVMAPLWGAIILGMLLAFAGDCNDE